MLPELDIATAAVFPDKWLACGSECKLQWVSEAAQRLAAAAKQSEQPHSHRGTVPAAL
jgi:hypothetical protein